MTSDNRWLLPDGIDELLPQRAAKVEHLRRQLLDVCGRWGFRYVIPPLVEFTDSLLVGLGADLNLLTCKFVDRLSGRTLGVRADITPQVARIDAHSLGESGITRLCYAGSTLHSAPQAVTQGRSPIQLGAEIYGTTSLSADLEVIELMLGLLDSLSTDRRVILDIGHVGIVEGVLAESALPKAVEEEVFEALQRKSQPDLAAAISGLDAKLQRRFEALLSLHGDVSTLARAHDLLSHVPAAMTSLVALERVVQTLQARHPSLEIYVDLTELRSFQYHTGLVFAAYLEGVGAAVAKGGRYDNVGAVYGRARPATGFAMDLKAVAGVVTQPAEDAPMIAAPDDDDPELAMMVRKLREEGRVVVTSIDGTRDERCGETLVKRDGQWILEIED
ncbi:MAG: ATP phosphoribosyltransferase regulatory subunit [Halieaceae bacterium]|jgi:ATP phosphoribosyltransferase regulatory subunit|nr:ATP phosphoribosyltransferase regulatory subunit [Halieaceae bacterium]